jgi:uncharacterized membrane protein
LPGALSRLTQRRRRPWIRIILLCSLDRTGADQHCRKLPANPVSHVDPVPVAFLVATLACDLLFWWTGYELWVNASLYPLGAALVMATLAAVAGVTDFLGDDRIRGLPAAWHHMIGNVIVVLLSLWNWYLRRDAGEAAVLPIGIIISSAVVLILLYTGWRGWEIVYRHRVAVSDDME